MQGKSTSPKARFRVQGCKEGGYSFRLDACATQKSPGRSGDEHAGFDRHCSWISLAMQHVTTLRVAGYGPFSTDRYQVHMDLRVRRQEEGLQDNLNQP